MLQKKILRCFKTNFKRNDWWDQNGTRDTPPELSVDLVDMGLTLTGGGALLKNIDRNFLKKLVYLCTLRKIH